jgi:hypothetical protein
VLWFKSLLEKLLINLSANPFEKLPRSPTRKLPELGS